MNKFITGLSIVTILVIAFLIALNESFKESIEESSYSQENSVEAAIYEESEEVNFINENN